MTSSDVQNEVLRQKYGQNAYWQAVFLLIFGIWMITNLDDVEVTKASCPEQMTWMNINIIIIAFYLVFFMFGKRVATMENIKQF